MARQTYVYDYNLDKIVPIEDLRIVANGRSAAVIGDIEPFVSPVSGKPVFGKRQLREHNKQHEVVDRREMRGHKFETPKLPPVGPDLARVFRQKTGRE